MQQCVTTGLHVGNTSSGRYVLQIAALFSTAVELQFQSTMMSTTFPVTSGQKTLCDMEDAGLVALAKSGSEAAYGELMWRTRSLCLRIATGLLGDPDEASDEVQNAFWRAYANLAGFESHAKFSTWMVRIVINCCMTRLRSEKVKTVPFDRVTEDGQAAALGYRSCHSDCPEG